MSQPHSLQALELGEGSVELTAQMGFVPNRPSERFMQDLEAADLVVNLADRLANYSIVFGLREAPRGSEPHGEWMRDQSDREDRVRSTRLGGSQQRLLKTGGWPVKHARYYWLLLAEGHLHRRLFGQMLRRIWALPVATG